MKKVLLLLTVLLMCFAWGCGKVNPMTMSIESADRETADIPRQCQSLFQPDRHVIAVVEFENRTTMQGGRAVTGASAAQVQVGATATGVAASATQNVEIFERNISPQLGEFAQSAVESTLVRIGGVTVLARAQMDKILREQHFQMTLSDPNTAVDFGRLSGAQFIVTGSVDNISATYTAPSEAPQLQGWAGVAAAVGAAVVNLTSGWNVEVQMTTNIIDVSTGVIINTSKVTARENVGDAPMLNIEQAVAGSKKAMSKAVERMVPLLNSQFTVKGHINELRGNKRVALVSIGSDAGLKVGDRVTPNEVRLQRDFVTNREDCIMSPLGFHMTVLSVTPNSAWVEVNTTDKARLANLKVGSLVIRTRTK